MPMQLRHPVVILAGLGSASGLLGTFLLGGNYGAAPEPGFYLVLAGIWFGLVMGFAVWRWGRGSLGTAAMTVATTWIAWEIAVNVAIQLDGPVLEAVLPHTVRSYVAGFVAGGVGSAITWAGVAAHVADLRTRAAGIGIAAVGAFLGLLLPVTNLCDSGAVLLVPWQAAVAAMIGARMVPSRADQQRSESASAMGAGPAGRQYFMRLVSVLAAFTASPAIAGADQAVIDPDESAGTIEELMKGGWQVAGYASNSDNRSTFILFKNPNENYLVQCLAGYDVTRSPRVFENCYRLR